MKRNWHNTALTQVLNIELPFIQAPMAGGYTTPELVAAVSNAGALGSLALGYLSPDEIHQAITATRSKTTKPFAVNLFVPEQTKPTSAEKIERARLAVQHACTELNMTVPTISPPYAPNFAEQMEAIIDENISILSFTFGIPSDSWLQKLKNSGITTLGTATTLAEIKQLVEKEIDIIVIQGVEAGGHRGSFLVNANAENQLTLDELLSVSLPGIKTPIVAAGGLMSGKQIVDVVKKGVAGVQMGTVFLCCQESGIHPAAKKLLLSQKDDHTSLTRAFSGKLARGITNQFMLRMQAHEDVILDYPLQNSLTNPMRKEAARIGNTEFMSVWAGQGAYLCRSTSASTLMQTLCEEIDDHLSACKQ